MMPYYSKTYTTKLLRENPDKIFVFGDNLARFGKGGQAVIRDEKNAFGVPTKRFPSFAQDSFFADRIDEWEEVRDSLRQLWVLSRGRELVFPAYGIGTGLARMKDESPYIYNRMCKILDEHFRVINGKFDERRLI